MKGASTNARCVFRPSLSLLGAELRRELAQGRGLTFGQSPLGTGARSRTAQKGALGLSPRGELWRRQARLWSRVCGLQATVWLRWETLGL